MTKKEKVEFLQEMKVIMEEIVDRTVDNAIDKAVDRAVNKSVGEAVDKAVDGKINQAIEKAIAPLREDIKQLKDITIPNMQEDIRNISRSVAVIEIEHGKKLDILFEALDINSKDIEENERRISTCERKIEKHEGEIYYLKSNFKKA